MSGCTAKPQKKLANHLTKYHPNIVGDERQSLLAGAKRVNPADIAKPFFKKVKGQRSLRDMFVRESPPPQKSSDDDDDFVAPKGMHKQYVTA